MYNNTSAIGFGRAADDVVYGDIESHHAHGDRADPAIDNELCKIIVCVWAANGGGIAQHTHTHTQKKMCG